MTVQTCLSSVVSLAGYLVSSKRRLGIASLADDLGAGRCDHRHMTAQRVAAATICALALVAGCGRGAGRGAASTGSHPPVFEPPGPFYQPPDPLPPGQPGELIRSQPLTAPPGSRAWRILYHSRTSLGSDVAVSGFVVVADARPPVGGRPVLAYAHGVRGLARLCAPSSATQPLEGLATFSPLLTAGAAVVATDYPGLGAPGSGGHPYLVGPSEARSVLDAVRAAKLLPGLGLGNDTVIFGDTQGGHAALFSGEIASGYAPELHLVGVAAEDPPTDLTTFERHAAGTSFAVEFLLEAAAGYSAANPAADLATILTPQGMADLRLLQTECDDEFGQATAGQSLASVFSKDPLITPPWSTGLAADSPGLVRVPAPILIAQGTADQQYPAVIVAGFVHRICALGDTVAYQTYPQVGHAITLAAAPKIIAWIADRIAGRPAPNTCR